MTAWSQPSLFAEPAVVPERDQCPHCASHWPRRLPFHRLTKIAQEHAEVDDRVCALMAKQLEHLANAELLARGITKHPENLLSLEDREAHLREVKESTKHIWSRYNGIEPSWALK